MARLSRYMAIFAIEQLFYVGFGRKKLVNQDKKFVEQDAKVANQEVKLLRQDDKILKQDEKIAEYNRTINEYNRITAETIEAFKTEVREELQNKIAEQEEIVNDVSEAIGNIGKVVATSHPQFSGISGDHTVAKLQKSAWSIF